MATVNDVLKVAKKEIGTKETTSNNVKYNTWYYGKVVTGSAYPWCMAFVQWVFNEAGMKLPYKTASCTALMNYAKQNGLWVTSGYKAGDIILYQFDNDTYSDHVGICESATSTTVTCIEGNTSGSGSQSNGGEVCRKVRKKTLVMGAYRPNYAGATTPKKELTCTVKLPVLERGSKNATVKSLQILLNGFGFNCGTPDSSFGINTHNAVLKFQKANGLDDDGSVGELTWSKLLK